MEILSTIMFLTNKYPCSTTQLNISAYNEAIITPLKKTHKNFKQTLQDFKVY